MRNDLPERRDEHGLSRADLAEEVGVTRQTINIERGRYNPSYELAFASRFDCHIEEIFDPKASQ